MSSFALIPMFLDSPQGRVFVLHHTPRDLKPHSGIVLVPPFAEEMNKSRRMLTLVAETLAERGFHVMLPDFYGTGDSGGDFADSSWDDWLKQLDYCINGMMQDFKIERYSLLAVRTGALLATQFLQQFRPDVVNLVMWQPVVDGSTYLTQFLRLRVASSAIGGGQKETTKNLKQMLAKGELIEVAGYGLTSAITDGLLTSTLKNITPNILPPTCWIDVVITDGQVLPLVNTKLVQSWSESGVLVQHEKCKGEPFWNSVEVIENLEIVNLTADFFCEQYYEA